MLLLPASSLVIVVLGTMWSLRNLGAEAANLRTSLRRFGASSVAVAELDREAAMLTKRAIATRSDAQARLHLHRRERLGR